MSFQRSRLACFATLPDGHGFEQTVAAAAGAGFDEFAIWLMAIDEARQALGSLEAVKDCMDRHGIRPSVMELVHAWASGDQNAIEEEREVLRTAAEFFDAEVVLAATLLPVLSGDSVGALREHCRALAPRRVALEFLPFSAIPDLGAALSMVDAVGEDNLGIVFDSWHFARAGADYDLLDSVPGEMIHFIQLNDADPEPWPDIFAETMGGRLRPGEGALDWPRLIGILADKPLHCAIGSEQYSDKVKAMDLDVACRYLFDSIQDILQDPSHVPS